MDGAVERLRRLGLDPTRDELSRRITPDLARGIDHLVDNDGRREWEIGTGWHVLHRLGGGG